MTKFEASALDLLLQRLTWPSGLVRERACVSLGSLLADADLGADVTNATLAWLETQTLESVAVFGLLALYQANSRGGGIPPWNVISRRLSKPSLLSWLVAKNLYEESVGGPVVSGLYSGSAPDGFEADPFFLRYVENFVPPIYLWYAKRIERKNCPGFLAQWAFEWTKLVDLTGFTLSSPYVSFWTRPEDDHLTCLDLPLGEVYRSAYLRALAWAVDMRGMPPSESVYFAAQTCPIDLGLWRVTPGTVPVSWPTCPPVLGSLDTIPGRIASEIGSLWQRQLAEDWVITKAGGRVHESENTAYDLDIIGVVQACRGIGAPDLGTLSSEDERREIMWGADSLLTFGGRYRRDPAEKWQQEHSDWLVWRLAALADPNTVPRWQWWRAQRGIWLPSPFLARKAFEFRCAHDAVVVEEEGLEIARWTDWTRNLQEMTTANLTPSAGQMLLTRRSLVEREAARLGGVFAWICKITTYQRKHSHEMFTQSHYVFDLGTTRIVR